MQDQRKVKITALGEREIVMTREFDAPRQMVFEALTTPALMKRWFGIFGGWSLAVCEVDLKVGGVYRYVWKNADDGSEMGVSGTYREIHAPEKIVHTEVFDNAWYPGESLISTRLEEKDGRTHFYATIQYASAAARDGVLKSPMEGGINLSYANLAELLHSLQA